MPIIAALKKQRHADLLVLISFVESVEFTSFSQCSEYSTVKSNLFLGSCGAMQVRVEARG